MAEQTNNKVLPYGRYTVQEVASNGKYRLTDGVDLLERAGIEVVYLGE